MERSANTDRIILGLSRLYIKLVCDRLHALLISWHCERIERLHTTMAISVSKSMLSP